MRWAWLLIISTYIGYLLRDLLDIKNWGTLSLLLVLSAAAIYFRLGDPQFRPLKKQWWNLSAIAVLLWAIYIYFEHTFGALDISSLLFHFQFGVDGHGEIKAARKGIKYLIGAALFALSITCLSNMDFRIRSLEWKLAGILILVNPIWLGTYSYVYAQTSEYKDKLAEYYFIPEILVPDEEHKKNLIVIYAESAEKTFSADQFADTYKDFDEIAKLGTSFDGVLQADNTGWTIAGMVASQCGVPLRPMGLITHNNFNAVEMFAPGIQCLGDILKSAGYQLSYMGGAALEFAGKGSFYRQHGFDRIQGLEELRSRVSPEYLNQWGVYDDSLFDLAMEEIALLNEANQPYGMFLLTIAGHAPDGYPAQRCIDEIEEEHKDTYRFAIQCTGYLIDDFLSRLANGGYLDNTKVVVLSDHLSMRSDDTEILKRLERHNTLILIPPVDGKSNKQDRASSMFDVFPTILDILDFEIGEQGAAGLGRSLLRDENQTLVERYGINELNRMILADDVLRERMWRSGSGNQSRE